MLVDIPKIMGIGTHYESIVTSTKVFCVPSGSCHEILKTHIFPHFNLWYNLLYKCTHIAVIAFWISWTFHMLLNMTSAAFKYILNKLPLRNFLPYFKCSKKFPKLFKFTLLPWSYSKYGQDFCKETILCTHHTPTAMC